MSVIAAGAERSVDQIIVDGSSTVCVGRYFRCCVGALSYDRVSRVSSVKVENTFTLLRHFQLFHTPPLLLYTSGAVYGICSPDGRSFQD